MNPHFVKKRNIENGPCPHWSTIEMICAYLVNDHVTEVSAKLHYNIGH